MTFVLVEVERNISIVTVNNRMILKHDVKLK